MRIHIYILEKNLGQALININKQMQAEIDPTLQIIPFDDKYAVRADIVVEKNSQKLFVMKTFMMFVLEIRSSMDERSIKSLKNFILQTCLQLIERGGIDNVGFVINKNYHTIKNPNYEGIKDLLNAHVKIDDNNDIRETLTCLRNSIHLEGKKMEQAKMSVLMFTSNVAENPLNPVKRTYRLKMNSHIQNYEKQIRRLGVTISRTCDDCYFYCIGLAKKYGNNKPDTKFGWIGCASYDKQAIDLLLLYRISSICKTKQFSYNVCQSLGELEDKFSQVSALILYEFHQFSLMVPVIETKKDSFSPEANTKDRIPKLIQEEEKQLNEDMDMEVDMDMDIDDQELEEYLKENKNGMQEVVEQELGVEVQIEYEPEAEVERGIRYVKLDLTNIDESKFSTAQFTYFSKTELNLKQIHERGYHIFKKVEKKKQVEFPCKNRIVKQLAYVYKPEYVSQQVNYHEPTTIECIRCQTQYYKQELADIMYKIRQSIVKYKKRFIGTYKNTKLFETYIEVDEALQSELRNRVYQIDQILRGIYHKIFNDQLIQTQGAKRSMFELYSSAKSMIDTTNEVFMNIFKKQIENKDIGKLTAAINYDKIKSSLKRKLIKRVNSNPKMIDDVYDKVEQVCTNEILDYVELEAKNKQSKSEVGNCMYTFRNFATALSHRDCLALIFQIERPPSAIADPGRIRIRQVSTLVVGVSKFFETHQYFIKTDFETSLESARKSLNKSIKEQQDLECSYCGMCQLISFCNIYNCYCEYLSMRDVPKEQWEIENKRKETKYGIQKSDYKENWDYWNRVQNKDTFFGVLPLYICEQNWKVAKQLMKPCMGWTACGEPLGYTYSQTQTIPFMVLSALIRSVQEQTYKIQELEEASRKCETEKERNGLLHQANKIKQKRERHVQLLRQTEKTCEAIMRDMSGVHLESPLSKNVVEKYLNYSKPICRTVDVINNNSSFLSQLYTVIRMGILERPKEPQFHEFFKRLIEEQLRRETDGWNEEQVEDKFINKLLNVQVEKMDKPQYMVLDSEYLDKFEQALLGEQVYRTQFQIQREALEMIIKQDNKFNDTQRLSIIQYKRLYENRVLWLWYVRFRLYQEKDRIFIHKWKCLDLKNSYQLFSMIIQNKKQRKNWKRREAILEGSYVDPFDYNQARPYLEEEFVKMRNKKQAQNIVLLNAEKYGRASQVFAMTRDLREAAGALMNVVVGREIAYYYDEIYKACNFMGQKLKMLLEGEYQGVRLFKHGWKMSKKRMNILRQHYPYEFQKYQYMF